LLLTACGRDADTTASPEAARTIEAGPATGTVTVWAQGAEAEGLPALLEEFESANPDVTVEVTAIPWDAAHSKYQTAIAGGTTPDVAQMGTTWMGDFSDAFDPTPEQIDTSAFFPGSVDSTEVDGTSYGVPWYVVTQVVFYRSDLAAEAGYTTFPTSWDDFKAMAAAMQTEAGAEYGIQLPPGGADSLQQAALNFVWSNGADLMNEEGTEWTLDTPEMVEALEYYQSFFTDGIADANLSTAAGAAESAFVSGEAPMLIGGPATMGELEQAGGAEFVDQYSVATLPTQESATSFVGGSNMVVFKESENHDAAWKLIRWLSQPEVQVRWYEATGVLPAAQSAWRNPSLAGDEKLAVFGEQLEDTNSPPSVPTWTQVSAAGDTQLEQIVKADKEPAEAMQELQATADSLGLGS